MSDPIKAALRVAAQGLEGSWAAGEMLDDPEALAAAAIAAFLRALPPMSRADVAPLRMYATQLANAVEEAARHE